MRKIFTIILFLILASMILAGCSSTELNDVEWRCSNTECAEYISGQEWAQQNCVQNANQIVCPVVVQGTQVLIPIEQINLSAVTACATFVCIEEMPVKVIEEPYELNTTA